MKSVRMSCILVSPKCSKALTISRKTMPLRDIYDGLENIDAPQ